MHAGTGGDAAFAGGFDQFGLRALLRRHAADDAFLALDVFFSAGQIGLCGLGRQVAGQLVHQAGEPAHLFHLAQLIQEVAQVKTAATLDLGRELLGRGHVHTGGDLLDQRNDVAHAENATGVALGVEHLEAVDFFGHTGELDRRAGDVSHRQCRTAARIAVGFGEDDAGQRQGVAERLGGVDRVLTLHGVDHKQGLHRLEHAVQLLDFAHERFVDGQATGGIDQQHVKEVAFGVIQRGARDVGRFLLWCAGKPFGTGLRGHGLELLDGGRAVDVARDGQHFFLALFNQVLGELGGGGGFTSTLQAGHQDHRWRLGRQIDIGHTLAHGGGQFAVDDRHQHLTGRERAHHLFAQGFFFDPGNKVAHHRQGHIGLQQGHAHLAHHLADVVFGDAGLAPHGFDDAG